MQIRNIVLYKDKDHIRILPFDLGKVNIITGESKSGKTALIDIINYCMGSQECNIASGVIRDQVSWFGITIVLPNSESVFIARKNPKLENKNSILRVHVQSVSYNEIPQFSSLNNNLNCDQLISFLSDKLGISENKLLPERGNQPAASISFSHARLFCFQPQTVIAQRRYLFYKQTEQFVPQSIKDSLPYFLGVIKEDSLWIEQEINQNKRLLSRLKTQKREYESFKTDIVNDAYSLIEEAKQVEILDATEKPNNVSAAIKCLEGVMKWDSKPHKVDAQGEDSVLKDLVNKRFQLKKEIDSLDNQILSTKSFITDTKGYYNEIEHQKKRLESINLFHNTQWDNSICPLCHNKLTVQIPSITAIQSSLKALCDNLQSNQQSTPHMTNYLSSLEKEKENIKIEIQNIDNSIQLLYAEKENHRVLRDLNIRRGKILGRISLFLEKVKLPEEKDYDNEINRVQNAISELEQKNDKENQITQLATTLGKINNRMTNWLTDLDTDKDIENISFNLSKLTLDSETHSGVVPLATLGSGANWVSFHLLIHFALHQYFIENNRPVPHFLILDQPTQVYFPSDNGTNTKTDSDIDTEAVKKMFDFIFDRTNELDSKFQVIITEHAYLKDARFQSCVKENWRNGAKLIPKDWLKS